MADISKITLPSGTMYYIKDQQARSDIAALQNAISGGMTVIGETTTDLSNGSNETEIEINGETRTAQKGNLVWKGSVEYLFDGEYWIEVGNLEGIGALGFKDTAEAEYQPSGTISRPIFSGTIMESSGTFTPDGSIIITTANGSDTYTPAGTNSAPQFTGVDMTSSGTFTPRGSVSKPNVVVTPHTAVVNSITDIGTLPELGMNVSNETLIVTFAPGTRPTKGSDQTLLTSVDAELAAAPVFDGTTDNIYTTGRPAGTVSAPVFTGTAATIEGSFSGATGNLSVTGLPEGTISIPSFTGTTATIEVS